MKLFIVLAVVGLSSCAKLDRTYLPPHAQTSGGSGNFLQTPVSGPNDFGSAGNGFGQGGNGNGFPNNGFGQKGFAKGINNVAEGGDNNPQNGNDFAQNGNEYQQNDFSQNGNTFAPNANFDDSNSGFGNGFDRPERPQAAFERNAAILRQDSQNDGETYSYSYETENGIYAEENGVATNGVEAQGGFSYTGDDGQVYSIRYTADQNGFVPQGDHIPTPPPVPEEILKALEQNARDEANGIFDDGSYQEGKYADDDANQYNGNGNNNYGSNNGNFGDNGNGNFANTNGNNNYGSDNGNFANNNGNNNFGSDNGNFVNTNGNQNYPGNFNGNSGDAVVTNSAAYLPPVENRRSDNLRPESGLARPQFAVRPSNNAQPSAKFGAASGDFRAPSGSFNVQPSANFAPSNGITGATNAYLPPRDQPRGPAGFQAQNGPQSSSNFGSRSSPRRPSFNARDGYQY